jgi:outer membrane protein, multidrug efflux system
MKRLFRLTPVLAAALLAACANLAPDYQLPAAPVAAAWPAGGSAAAGAASDKSAAELPWTDFFLDARLRNAIAAALDNNRDLRAAALQIEQARAIYRIQRAERFPTVEASATTAAQRTPASLSPGGQAATTHQYEAGIGFSRYELDFFGRLRNLNEQALQAFLATAEARRSVHISLIAEVANAYLTLAADRERLRLACSTFDSQDASYTLIRRRFELGAASQLDLRRAQTTVDAARADVARFTSLVAQDENALALLVGAPLRAEWLPELLAPVTSLADVPTGVPSDVLQRRPDIRQAEHRLQAAHAVIGQVRAAFFPSVTLTTFGGVASNELSDLFRGGAGAWSFVPRIALPIFDGGRNRATLQAAEVGREIALAEYERAIQGAFREVADTLAARGTLGLQLEAQQSFVEAAADSQRLSDIRFRQGAESYLTVLDAQRSLYAAEQVLITLRLARLSNQVALYKVLGGGWSGVAVDAAADVTAAR